MGRDRPVDRPFVDEPMRDLVRASVAAVTAAEQWGLATPELVRSGMNALYACDDVMLRVGMATADPVLSHELAGVLAAHGVPTVTPVHGLAAAVDGVAVTAWVRARPVPGPPDWSAVGRAVRRVHELELGDVPDGYPTPSPASFPWWDFEGLLDELRSEIDDAAARGLQRCLDEHDQWRTMLSDAAVVCHGDVHPGNVLATEDGPLLTDWDLLCVAPPGWDHAMLTTYATRWGGPAGTYEAFATGYGASLADERVTVAIAELRNVAATLMRVRAGRTDPAAAEEAERRLRYWRGDPDAPVWRAQ